MTVRQAYRKRLRDHCFRGSLGPYAKAHVVVVVLEGKGLKRLCITFV